MGVFSKNIGADADLDPVDEVKLNVPSDEEIKAAAEAKERLRREAEERAAIAQEQRKRALELEARERVRLEKLEMIKSLGGETRDGVLFFENFPAGGKLVYEGPVVVEGTIEKGAHLCIDNGHLYLKGYVKDDVMISVQFRKSSLSLGSKFNRASEGSAKSWSRGSDHEIGIKIEGSVGDYVTLKTTGAIRLNYSGKALNVSTESDFSATGIGADAVIIADGDVSIDRLGAHSKVDAGKFYNGLVIEADSTVIAGHSVKVNKIYQGVRIDAKQNLYVKTAHRDSHLSSRGRALVDGYMGQHSWRSNARRYIR